ncbi:FixH family protein [Gracilibacillus sp. S3-1-1]|uniref:FixH family protein n=1 Tax=Gracilibacillus pellucidus TaxID=3095368 RepID=A0ACC6M4N1_9BACI|nr:FixH family protein [Gracilibacillus sp. S3-1-1]MDX8045871.1 FixH family protein [Gracilibacillus sp. S3-1-1]
MKRGFLFISIILVLVGCRDEVKGITVDFTLPETANTGESVLLETTVTYGEDELVTDAEEMTFEYWNTEDPDNTVHVDATNHHDGTYSAEVTFTEPGTFEIYAHTTARSMHSMPKKSITVEGEQLDDHHAEEHETEHAHQADFNLSLQPLDEITVGQSVDIAVELTMDQNPLTGTRVRYEIIPENSDKHDWIDAEETEDGFYHSTHSFEKAGHYKMVVHVTDDDGLHEHEEFHFDVEE